MKTVSSLACLLMGTLLISCDRQEAAPDVDPQTGRACFERHRALLPPGTQYEGIDVLSGNRLTIKIMDGIEVRTVDCELDPNGSLLGAAD